MVVVASIAQAQTPSSPVYVHVYAQSGSALNVTWQPFGGGQIDYEVFRDGVSVGSIALPPFADSGFGAAYLRWVLHLIPTWNAAMEELRRVVRPEGTIVVSLGTLGDGPKREIQQRFVEVAGTSNVPAGLDWGDWETLDDAMAQLRARPRPLPTFLETDQHGVGAFMDAREQNRHSWTGSMPVALRLRTAAEVRAWAKDRFGPLDQLPRQRYEVIWRAYDLA